MRNFACREKVDWLVKNCHISKKSERELRQANAFIKEHALFSRTASTPLNRILSIKNKRVLNAVIKAAEIELSKRDSTGKPLKLRLTEPEVISIMNIYEKQNGAKLTTLKGKPDISNRFRLNKSQMAYLNELIKRGRAKTLREAITQVFNQAKKQTA